MFQHTVDRADRLTLRGRRVSVIAPSHALEVSCQLSGRDPGIVAVQPSNRDTAAGVLLALAHVRARDPEAMVVLYPSDHFIYPEDRFVEVVASAVSAAESLEDRLVILAVRPDRPEREYGWMEAGPVIENEGGYKVRSVRSFLEKPTAERARHAMASGALWNTLVLAARLRSIWSLAWRCLPELMHPFERIARAVDDAEAIAAIYRRLPNRNFSSDLLARVPGSIGAMELRGVLWNDWGTPERILETLHAFGKDRVLACAVDPVPASRWLT